MKDLPLHLLLFFLTGTVVVVISTLQAEPDGSVARRVLPARWLKFFLTSALVVAVMLLVEHTLASVS